jgi:predicted nucleic acid-binding protein
VKVLVDANVCLDVLLSRAPFGDSSTRIWSLAEEGHVVCLVPAHAVTTVHYLVSKERDRTTGRRFVADLIRVFRVAPVNEAVLRRALELEFTDFEDAVCAAAAEAAGCDLVVTRNGKDFARSPVTAVDPVTALALVEGGGSGGVSERGAPYGRPRSKVRARRSGRGGGARATR